MDAILFLGLSVLEVLAIGVFFILLAVASAFDRRGVSAPKWYVFVIGLIGVGLYYGRELHFDSVLSFLTSGKFWMPVGIYIGIGLAYSAVEFTFLIRRCARGYTELWKRFLSRTKNVPVYNEDGTVKTQQVPVTYSRGIPSSEMRTENVTEDRTLRDLLLEVKAKGKDSKHFGTVNDELKSFSVSGLSRDRDYHDIFVSLDPVINVDIDFTTYEVSPSVNKKALAESVGVWSLMWPAYALSMVFGDLLTEVFNAVAEFFVKISGRFVKLTFADVFKI